MHLSFEHAPVAWAHTCRSSTCFHTICLTESSFSCSALLCLSRSFSPSSYGSDISLTSRCRRYAASVSLRSRSGSNLWRKQRCLQNGSSKCSSAYIACVQRVTEWSNPKLWYVQKTMRLRHVNARGISWRKIGDMSCIHEVYSAKFSGFRINIRVVARAREVNDKFPRL